MQDSVLQSEGVERLLGERTMILADATPVNMSTAAKTREAIASAPTSVKNTRLPAVHRLTRGGWLKQKTVKKLIFVAGDALALLLSSWAAKVVVQQFLGVPGQELTAPRCLLFCLPFFLGIFHLFERSQSHEVRRPENELELVAKSVSCAFLLLVCANFVVFKAGLSRYLMVCWYVLGLATVLAARYGIRVFYGRLWEHGLARRRTLLVGSAEKMLELQQLLAIQRYRAYEIIGILPEGSGPPVNGSGPPLPVLGSLDQCRRVVEENRVEQLIVALPNANTEAQHLVSVIQQACLAAEIDVQVYSGPFASRKFKYELDEFSGLFRFYAASAWPRRLQMALKFGTDVLAGLAGSLLAAVLTPVIGALIILEDGGPIFYRSAYVGPRGEERYLLKFRSMRVDADRVLKENPEIRQQFERQYKLANDPRVTRAGRFLRKYSLDEFPSFFNILRGEVSLVGPRTIMREQQERYGLYLPKLLSVKPGLTGFWQVMGRQLTSHDERVQMDMFYIDHWSIWLDLWIVGRTFWKVLCAEGAY